MKSGLIVVCMLLLILCSLSFVTAHDVTNETQAVQITQTVNDTALSGDSAEGSFNDLQSEINNAAEYSTLELDRNYKGFERSNINLDKSLTIDGKGHTLDCGGYKNSKAFTSNKGDITLRNLIIESGHGDTASLGGAIFITGTSSYTIINCTFINNWAKGYGGAIYNNVAGNSLNIINSTFYQNKADDNDGGAIYSKGELNVVNSIFETNTANIDGGAIYAENSITVYSSKFTSNYAEPEGKHISYGGAICAKDEIYVQNCIFDSNFADDNGGAVYAYKIAYFKNTTFKANTARDAGGAIYKCSSGSLVIEDSKFSENNAESKKGGAVYSAGKLTVKDSSFSLNTAKDYGGAVYSDSIQFSGRVSFIGNAAKNHGGAVYTNKIANYVENLYFESNHADDDYGGALYINDKCGDVTFYNSTFVKNHAIAGDGGAIYTNSPNIALHLVSCVFSENYATGGVGTRFGGAVCSQGDIYVANSTFSDNWAENSGGAIYAYSKAYVTDNSQFIKNYVQKDKGGAIWCRILDSIKDSLFVSNRAEKNDGGAVYQYSKSNPTIKNSYFESNYCSGRGGAIFINSIGQDLYLNNNAFISNNAGGQGKDVFNSGTYKSISGNWWGTNSPSFNNEKLMEYKIFGSNKRHSDAGYNTVSVSGDAEVYTFINNTIRITFSKAVSPFLFDKIELSSDKAATFADRNVNGNTLEVTFIPQETGKHRITVRVNSQTLTFDLTARYTSVYGFDVVKTQGDSNTYCAVFKDMEGNYLPEGTEVSFAVGTKIYHHKVSDEGIAAMDEIFTFSPGVYDVKAINGNTGEFFMNKITVLSRNITYNLNDTFVMEFINVNKSDNITVTFKIAGKTFESNVTNGFAFFQLDVPAGNHTVDVIYEGRIIQSMDIEVLNRYSPLPFKINGSNYASLIPISYNETFKEDGMTLYSEIGENLRRYVLPTGEGYIIYNVTVSNSDELERVLNKIYEIDFYVDIIIINLKKNTYTIKKGNYRDQEWNYLIHLTHSDLFINGNGATLADGYHNNFMTIESGCTAAISNLTFEKFYRVFVNNGELLCTDCKFVKNDANFISTSTPGSVIYNKKTATFEHCTFDSNDNGALVYGFRYYADLQAVFYADENSLINFVKCDFGSEKGKNTLRAVDGSMVVLYDDDKTNYDFFAKGVTSCLELGSCLDYRPLSSYNKANKTSEYTFNDLTDFVSKVNNELHYDDASDFIINLENGNYSVDVDTFKNIASPYDFRTYNREGSFFGNPGPKDNYYAHHRYLLEVGSRPIVLNGNGATISLTGASINGDNHFAFVPNYGSLTLINLTIMGFNTAIVNHGQLIVINCTFDSNQIHYFAADNKETENGGAIRNYGSLYCYNSTFKNNRATEGAAYYSKGGSAFGQFYNCVFKDNAISSNWVWNDGGENTLCADDKSVVKIINCKGINDLNIEKKKDAMVLYRSSLDETVLNFVVDGLSSLYRLSSLVKYNTKYDMINVTFEKGDYTIFPDSKILFEMNYGILVLSGNGARIFVNNPEDNDESQFMVTTVHSTVLITDMTIEGFNIAIDNKGGLNIMDSSFIKNRVDYKKKDDYGGAIVNEAGASLTVYNTTFKGNYAKYGGAIYNRGTAKVFISNFADNTGYNKNTNVDIYNHQSAVSIITVGNYPKVVDNFPMAAWKEDVIKTSIHLAIIVASSGASFGISYAGITAASIINMAVGAGIGAIGGAVHGYIYAYDHEDYSAFSKHLFEGVKVGMKAVPIGNAISSMVVRGHILSLDEMTNPQIIRSAFDRYQSTLVNKIFTDLGEIITGSKSWWKAIITS